MIQVIMDHRQQTATGGGDGINMSDPHSTARDGDYPWVSIGLQSWFTGLRRNWSVVAACWLAMVAHGCAKPIQPNLSRLTHQPQAASSRADKPNQFDPSGTSPVDGLTVNAESVKATAMWNGLHEDLALQAKNLTAAEYQAFVEQRAARLITDRIPEMLLHGVASSRLSESMNAGIDKYVDEEIRRIVTTQYDGVQRKCEKDLESKGSSLEDLRSKLRREIVITSYLDAEIKPKVAEPTRAELLAAYEANAASFRRPARRKMSLIDVRVGNRLPENIGTPTPAQLETARTEARSQVEAARAKLLGGDDFAEVAKRYSDGLHASEGGAWGWVTPGSVRERFEPAVAALFELGAGEVSDILETDDAYFVVRCDEVDGGYEPDFQSLQPELSERLFRAAYNKQIMEIVTDLRDKARIEPANLDRFHAAVVAAAPSRESLLSR